MTVTNVGKYFCWGPDNEDVTARVEAAIETRGNWGTMKVMDAEDARKASHVNEVVVYCSNGT